MNKKHLIKLEIEFKPRLILWAIHSKKSIILKDIPQAKAIVLERFNGLFFRIHDLTLIEDIPGILTTKENKELMNFNKEFKVISICKAGDEMESGDFFV